MVRATTLDRDLDVLLRRRVEERRELLQARVARAFLEARVEGPDLPSGPPPRPDTEQTVGHWLDALACWLLTRRYPSFERFAPRSGPLPKDALRQLMRVAAEHDLGDHEGDEYVKLIREAYLVPMGLMRREGWHYTAVANLDRHELVRAVEPVDLLELLPVRADHQWLVVDGLGLPLLNLLEDRLARLPGFGVEAVDFARVTPMTTTEAWFRAVADAGVNHPLVKVNGVDRLLHDRELTFVELSALAGAELEMGLARAAKNLERARPVLVFADHGFRLDRDGRRFVHGGASTLERVVPVVTLTADR